MFDLRTVSSANRDTIVAMAQFLDRGESAPANQGAHQLTLTPQQLQAVFDILGASRRDASANAPSSADESSSSGEPSAKRVAVKRKMPMLVQSEWDVLRASGQEQNDQLFMRAQARALRSLVLFFNSGCHKRVKAEIFSFLTTQELCAMSECSRESNYESPRVWRALGESYKLPKTFWKNARNEQDLSKRKTLANFKFLQRANSTFDSSLSPHHPLLRPVTTMAGVALKELRKCSHTDPLERFLRYTRYWMQTIIAKSPKETEHANFYDYMKVVGTRALHPKNFAELFFACGENVDGTILNSLFGGKYACTAEYNNRLKLMQDPSILEEWNTLITETALEAPLLDSRGIDRLIGAYGTDIPNQTLTAILTQHLQRGLKIPCRLLENFATKIEKGAPLELYGKLIDAAFVEKLEKEDRYNTFDFQLRYVLDNYFPSGNSFSLAPFLSVEQVIQIIQRFTPHTQRDGIGGSNSNSGQHESLVAAAKKGSRELMEALFTAGFRPHNKPTEHDWNPTTTLTLAIKEKISLELMLLLCEFGAKPDNEAFMRIGQYDPNLQVQDALRQVFLNSVLDRIPVRMALNP